MQFILVALASVEDFNKVYTGKETADYYVSSENIQKKTSTIEAAFNVRGLLHFLWNLT